MAKKKKKSSVIYNNIELESIKNRPFESDMNSMLTLPDGRVFANRTKDKKKWLVGYWKYAK